MNADKNNIIYSIVVPVYNSVETLPKLYERLVKVMEGFGKTFEIIFVEDSGQDNSWKALFDLAEKDERVSAIQLMRNYGQARATMCGLRHSKGHFIITIDDDLQHPPEEIPVIVQALEQNPNTDVIIGIPHEKKKHALWRNLGSEFVNIINTHVFKKDQSLKFSGFRIIRRQVVDCLVEQNVPQPAISALLISITSRIKNIGVQHEPRASGKSGYTLAKIFTLTLSNFLAFSIFPLRFLAIIGVVGVVGSIVAGAAYFAKYLMGGIGMPGFTTLVLLLIGISGFIFFAFGLLGEYLLRILQSVHFTPQYIVRQEISARTQKHAGNAVRVSFANLGKMQSEIQERKFE